jgi:hypothetical protein
MSFIPHSEAGEGRDPRLGDATMRDAIHKAYGAYMFCQNVSGGSYSATLSKHLPDWSRTALLALRNNFDPGEFVRAQFDATHMEARRVLRPSDMHSPQYRALQRAANSGTASAPTAQDPGKIRHIVMARLAAAERAGVPRLDYLRDPDQSIPAWLRVLESGADPVVVEWFGKTALSEYSSDVTLSTFVKETYGFGTWFARAL